MPQLCVTRVQALRHAEWRFGGTMPSNFERSKMLQLHVITSFAAHRMASLAASCPLFSEHSTVPQLCVVPVQALHHAEWRIGGILPPML